LPHVEFSSVLSVPSVAASKNQVECGNHCSIQRQFSPSGPAAQTMPRPSSLPTAPVIPFEMPPITMMPALSALGGLRIPKP